MYFVHRVLKQCKLLQQPSTNDVFEIYTYLHCTLASGAVYCNHSCLWVCDSGRAVSEPYYSQHASCIRVLFASLWVFFLSYFCNICPRQAVLYM